MAKKYWRGGAYTLRAVSGGNAASDGDWNEDDTGGGADSNWIDTSGAACAKPVDGTDEAIFSEFASLVPSNYSEAAEPHVPGKHFCCCHNLNQGADGGDIDLPGITITSGYDPGTGKGIFGWKTKTLTATETDSADAGASTLIYCTNHGFAVGDYVTITGTVHLNGEFRISAVVANVSFTIPLTYVAETPPVTAVAVARTPLKIGITAGNQITFQSNCTAYIESSHDTLNIPKLVFDSASGLLHISSDDGAGAANWAEIRDVNTGTLKFADNTEFTKIIVGADAEGGTVIVGKGCLGPAAVSCDLDASAGSIIWDSKIGDVFMDDGNVVYCKNVDLATTVNIDKLQVFGDANFDWYGKSTLSDYEQWNGTVTAKGAGTKVIGSGSSTAYPLRGGVLDLSQATGMVSLGSGDSIDCQGGELKVPKRSNVSW